MSDSASNPSSGTHPGGYGRRSGDVRLDGRRRLLTRLIFISILLALLGLAVTAVHFVWPTPLMFTLFMTVGQGAFVAAMVLYVIVILADLRGRGVL